MSRPKRKPVMVDADVLDLDRLRDIIALGADVNQPMRAECSDWAFPLGIAATEGDAEACRLLLEAGANPDVWCKEGPSVFFAVVEARKSSFSQTLERARNKMTVQRMSAIFNLLVQHGANPDRTTDPVRIFSTESPIFLAASEGDIEAIHALARAGADLEVKCETLRSTSWGNDAKVARPLRAAMRFRRDAAITALLQLGVDDAALAEKGLTPFQSCVAAGMDGTIKYYLQERGEGLAQRSIKGRTLAQIAQNDSTRVLLRSYKTELAVIAAIEGQSGSLAQAKVPRARSVTPL
jgi:ankyrin repeat protein